MKLVFRKYGIDFINGQRQQLQENAFQPGDTQLVKRHTLTLVKHVVCRSLSETSYLDILNFPYRGTRRGVTAPRHPGGVCSVYLLNSGKESSYLSNHMFRTTVLSHHTQFPDLISKLGIQPLNEGPCWIKSQFSFLIYYILFFSHYFQLAIIYMLIL